jgi:hypothetical protein
VHIVGQPDILKSGHGGDAFVLGVWYRSCYPPEITMASSRVQAYDEVAQDQIQCDDVDLVKK